MLSKEQECQVGSCVVGLHQTSSMKREYMNLTKAPRASIQNNHPAEARSDNFSVSLCKGHLGVVKVGASSCEIV